jgi:hypothetical protein
MFTQIKLSGDILMMAIIASLIDPINSAKFVAYETGFNTNLKSYELYSTTAGNKIGCGNLCEKKVSLRIDMNPVILAMWQQGKSVGYKKPYSLLYFYALKVIKHGILVVFLAIYARFFFFQI